MDKCPLVSVVIPTYNRVNFLKEAISSVLGQNYSEIELIVVDDGSSDGSEEWCKSLNEGSENERFRYVRIAHSGFPGLVRNVGIRMASGEYIAFLDSDDIWIEEKIEEQINLMESRVNCVISHTKERWVRNRKEISQSRQRHRREGDIFEDALLKCIIGPSTVMVRKDIFNYAGFFNEHMEIAEDYELWLRVTALYRVCYIDRPLVVKRGGHSDQLSEKYGQIEIFRIEALESFIEWLSHAKNTFSKLGWNPERYPLVKSLAYKELARKCSIYARGCFKRGREREGRSYLEKMEKYNTLYRQSSIF